MDQLQSERRLDRALIADFDADTDHRIRTMNNQVIITDSTARKRNAKSIVLMTELILLRDKGIKLDVQFDEDGEPIEKNGAKYVSYIGLMARAKVPIDIPTWKHVGHDLKLKIWEEVLTIFNVPETKKKQVFSIANSTWNGFKSKLTALYVYRKPPKKRMLPAETDPTKKYPYITSEVWKRFKEKRMTTEFQALSKIGAEKQSNNKYPHKMSRGGYRNTRLKLEKKMRDKEKEKDNDAAVYDLVESSQSPTIKRGDLWIEGRVDKNGETLNSETGEKIEELKKLNEMVKKGEFVPCGKDDELSKALGTDERYGRVRGVGGRVGHKQYFGKCKKSRSEGVVSKEFLEKLTQQITEQVTMHVRAEMCKDIEVMVEQRTNGNVSYSVEKQKDAEVELNSKSGNGSSYDNVQDDPDPFADIPDKGVECELAVKDTHLKVAHGRVFKAPTQASTCHGRAFGADELRVCIDVVMENMEETPLPLPTDEFFTVGEAIGSFVKWPRNLISLRVLEESQKHHESEAGDKSMSISKCRKRKRVDESTDSKKVESAKSKTNDQVASSNITLKTLLDQKCGSTRFLSKVVSMMGETLLTDVDLSEDVLGAKRRLRLAKEDFSALLNKGKISLPVIQTFVGYLSSVRDIKTYGFLCPEMTSVEGSLESDLAVTYISDWMKSKQSPIYIAPYYKEDRWMLVVIDIVEHNQVYWFDSLGNSVPSTLRTLINTSIRTYGYTGGSRKSSQAPQWVKVNCARQPSVVECGYYIMRYMLEIITRPTPTTTINEIFQDKMAYSEEEINQVRDLWANYFLNV